MSNCLPQVRELIRQSGKRVSEPVIRQMYEHMQSLLEHNPTPYEFSAEMKTLIGDEMRRRAESVKLAKLMALTKYESVSESAVRNKALGISAYEHLRSTIEGGSLKAGDGLNLSAEGQEKTLMSKFLTMFNQLAEIKDEIKSGLLDQEIVQEKAALQGEGQAGATKNAAAKKAAEIFHAIQRTMFDLKQANNPMMRFNENYYFEATHSADLIAAVPKEEWIQSVLQTHGEKSFPELSGKEKLETLGNIYDSITSGTYGSMQGGGNILFSMAKGRVLVPNDWQSFFKYHQRFGEGNIAEVMYSSMRSAAREISLLQKFGPEYRNYLDESYKRAYNAASPEDRVQLEAKKEYLRQAFRTAIGDMNMPASGQRAKLVQGAMMWENMSLNGSPVIASMPDFALSLGLLQDTTGKTQLEIAKDLFQHFTGSASNPTEAAAIARRIGLYTDAHSAAMMRDLGSNVPAEGFGGKTGKALRSLSELYGKATLMGRYLEASRSAVGITLSNYLSELTQLAHEGLPAQVQKGLARYGIGAAEWKALKFGTEEVDFRGNKVPLLSTESIMAMPDAAIENYLRKAGRLDGDATKAALDKGRLDLALKIGAMINEHADLGTSTSTTRTRTFLYRGTTINDGWGQIYRMMGQFKSAGLTSMDVVRRRYYSGQGAKGNFAGVAQTGAQLMFIAALAQYANDAAHGKTPEDPRNPGFILKVATRSGLGGPYSDALLGELSRNGIDGMMLQTLKSTVGPVPSKALEAGITAAQYGKTAYQNELEHKNAKYPNMRAYNLATSQIPGQNLFYATGLLNYYFLNGMREHLDHGWAANLKRQMSKTPGLLNEKQKYFAFDPSK